MQEEWMQIRGLSSERLLWAADRFDSTMKPCVASTTLDILRLLACVFESKCCKDEKVW